MEEPAQKFPLAFSQMLKLFPNIPRDVVWMYVQQYSNDPEKCSQMLTLLCTKYVDLEAEPVTKDYKNLIQNENILQKPIIMKPIEITCNFNDEIRPSMFKESVRNDIINQNTSDQNDVQNMQSTDSVRELSPLPTLLSNDSNTDCSKNLTRPVNFEEPLMLNINIDEENDSLHSWRPNMSLSCLCPDFFMASPMLENFQTNRNQMPNSGFERTVPELQKNPGGFLTRQSNQTSTVFYGYPLQNENMFNINYENHLHFQKSQMNAIRFEVIKAKIELSELQESIEKLKQELLVETESKNVQDIDKINEEIVQLRLECQCLCTEVDFYSKDKVLLGEIDEKCYSCVKSSTTDKSEEADKDCEHSTVTNGETLEEVCLWQCPKCTFDNHPAINACEMCQLPRGAKPWQKPPYLRTPPDECFCHPKKGTLSIQS